MEVIDSPRSRGLPRSGGAAAEALAENVAADAVALLLEQPVQLAHRECAGGRRACPDSGAAPAGIARSDAPRAGADCSHRARPAVPPIPRRRAVAPARAGRSAPPATPRPRPPPPTAAVLRRTPAAPAGSAATAGAVRREFAEGPLAGWQVPAYLFAGEMERGVFDESVGNDLAAARGVHQRHFPWRQLYAVPTLAQLRMAAALDDQEAVAVAS